MRVNRISFSFIGKLEEKKAKSFEFNFIDFLLILPRWTIGHRSWPNCQEVCGQRRKPHARLQAQRRTGEGLQGDVAEEHEQNLRVHQRSSAALSELFGAGSGD